MLVTRDSAIKAYVYGMTAAELYNIIRKDANFKAYWWYPRSAINQLMQGYKPEEVIGSLAPDFDNTMLFVKFNRHGYLESDDGYKRGCDMDNLRPRIADYFQQKTVGDTGNNELDTLINAPKDTVFNMVFNS